MHAQKLHSDFHVRVCVLVGKTAKIVRTSHQMCSDSETPTHKRADFW